MTFLPPSLSAVLTSVFVVVLAMTAVASVSIVGPARLRRLRETVRSRMRTIGPSVAVLVATLAVNSVARKVAPELSWMVGVNVTPYIHAIESTFVAGLQSVASPSLTAFFSFIYIYGYVFLLVFPFVAYLAMSDLRTFRRLVVAYIVNYGLGLLCYVVFISYGPRNFMPDLVEPLLFSTYPQLHFLTSEVNANTNVFPSLHTSLSTTVALLAYSTRDTYPRWFVVAGLLAASVVFATMYLGIHWAIDVVAGFALAAFSVLVGGYYVNRTDTADATGTEPG